MFNAQFREFLRGLRIHIGSGDLLSLVALLFVGILFLLRKVRHEFLMPAHCRKCGGPIELYFMRSTRSITGDETCDDEELSDWMVCKDDECREAQPLQ